ncbi:hypothetical protein [Exiguobacterium sp. s193]|uniref:hypothetical protein n=1 Tax=Exiguobacterium sp. s193 TaxID=2751207 RepID=UPI001BE722A3|nr:hypothetical protein [Exiguobacterium sp. s193]
MPFLRQLINYLQTTLVPNRSFLKTRLVDVSLYFCGLAWISFWTTVIDSLFITKTVPLVIWLILHFIFIAIAILLFLLLMSYLNRWLIAWLLPRPWAYRQVFPYTVAANLWSFPVGVLCYQLGLKGLGVTIIFAGHFLYSLIPVFLARKQKKTAR